MKHIVPDIRIQFKQPSMILLKTQSNTQPLKSMSSVCQAARSFCGGWDCRLRSTVTNLIPVLNTSSNWSQQRCSSFTLLWKDMMPKFKWLHCWLLIKEWGLNSDCISINKTPVISTRQAQYKWDENHFRLGTDTSSFSSGVVFWCFFLVFHNLCPTNTPVVCQQPAKPSHQRNRTDVHFHPGLIINSS